MRFLLIIAVVASLHCTLSLSIAEDAGASLSVSETIICDISAEDEKTLVISQDHRRIAYKTLSDNGYIIITDGKAGKKYSDVSTPLFSPDSKKVAYAASDGNAWMIVEDERVGTKYDKIYTGAMMYSPDSKDLIYPALKAGDYVLVIGRREIKTTGFVNEIRYSADGKHMAYYDTDAMEDSEGKMSVYDGFWVLDGKQITGFGMQRGFVLSPDGRHYAMYGVEKFDNKYNVKDIKSNVIIDGVKKERVFETQTSPTNDCFAFSKDGKRIMYKVHKDEEVTIVLENNRFGPYKNARLLGFSPGGKRAFWSVGDRMYVDGAEIRVEGVKDLGGISLSDKCLAFNGENNYAFASIIEGGVVIIEDGKRIGAYKAASAPVYNKKGELCYVAIDEEKYKFVRKGEVVYEGEGKFREAAAGETTRLFCLSEDGEGYSCYIERNEGKSIVVNGVCSCEYTTIIKANTPPLHIGDASGMTKGIRRDMPLPKNLPPGSNPGKMRNLAGEPICETTYLAVNGDTVNFIAIKDGKLLKCEAKIK